MSSNSTPLTKPAAAALITKRLLEFHKQLVEDYGLKRVSDESPGGVIVDCMESDA